MCVDRFPILEEHIRVLRRPAHDRPIWCQRTGAMCLDELSIDHRANGGGVERLNLADFVRGAKSIEKM